MTSADPVLAAAAIGAVATRPGGRDVPVVGWDPGRSSGPACYFTPDLPQTCFLRYLSSQPSTA